MEQKISNNLIVPVLAGPDAGIFFGKPGKFFFKWEPDFVFIVEVWPVLRTYPVIHYCRMGTRKCSQ